MANVKGRAGVVGLGMIGGGIAESLIRCGFVPVVGDICAERMQAFAGRAVLAKSAAEVAAQSDVVMVCVVNALQARAVICGEEGLLSSKHSGLIVCLVSTLSRREVLELNAVCEGAGVHLLDCGVSPGYLAAQNGMAAMVGGSADAVECARAVIEGWAKKLIYCGEIGAGMAVKLARNVFTFGCWRGRQCGDVIGRHHDFRSRRSVASQQAAQGERGGEAAQRRGGKKLYVDAEGSCGGI